MANGILSEAEFENQIGRMGDRELSEFIARQVYDVCQKCKTEDKRITMLEQRNNKLTGAIGGASGVLGATIIAVIDWFTKQG